MTPLRTLVLVAALLTGPAHAQDPIIRFTPTDAWMDNAAYEARKSLPLFLANVLSPEGQPLRDDILVKVGMPAAPGAEVDGEDVWVRNFHRLPDGSFAGALVSKPQNLGDLDKGDTVAFTQPMISDWFLLAPSGRYYGAYSLRVLHGQGAFGEAPFDQVFEPEPVPTEWR